jgi:hypothetical protein
MTSIGIVDSADAEPPIVIHTIYNHECIVQQNEQWSVCVAMIHSVTVHSLDHSTSLRANVCEACYVAATPTETVVTHKSFISKR